MPSREGELRSLLAVRSDPPFDLAAVDPRATPGLPPSVLLDGDPKGWSRSAVAAIGGSLAESQNKLYASAKVAADPRRVLLVLQAMDCGGKDGTIRTVAGALNPQGLRVVAFGPPTDVERRHHFLWRVAQAVPPAGAIGVFNRSHYEDVLAARVRGLVPERTWQRRYDEINEFEAGLVSGGVTLIKVMLHISADEQRERLLARLDDPAKRWKFDPADVDERARWADYQAAYADALARCSTPAAPWYVVPADRKWYRNWAVATLTRETLDGMALAYPSVQFDVPEQRRRLAEADETGAVPG
ncbi:PPK2 family polyphosphate kinase [Luedemannella helvata]|uniref:Polyphosphate kinase 2 family protein n=1 Tax=Luedemannella helvata TaxID=349315 RepID=A0ABP4WZE5_9ACTN